MLLYMYATNPYNHNEHYSGHGIRHALIPRIGKRIKQCRERLGLTQEQFAEKTGLTTNYISTVERGAILPSL